MIRPNLKDFNCSIEYGMAVNDYIVHLETEVAIKTKQKLKYEKMYWDVLDELVAHGIRKSAIRNDASHG